MNQDQNTPKLTREEVNAARVRSIRHRKYTLTPTERILGAKMGKQPLPTAPKIMVPNSWHGKRKQRRSAYEVPGQTAAERGLGLSDRGNIM